MRKFKLTRESADPLIVKADGYDYFGCASPKPYSGETNGRLYFWIWNGQWQEIVEEYSAAESWMFEIEDVTP